MKISDTEIFANKILKSTPKVTSFKYLRLSRFMCGNIHLVYLNESNFLPKEIKMKHITFLLESSFIKCHVEVKCYLVVT